MKGDGQHPKAEEFLRRGLFDELQSLTELEERIALLPTEKERGDAFEVFAQGFLGSIYPLTPKAIHLLPLPTAIAERLHIPATVDRGVDGVLETHAGELIPYQVKFRSDRSMPDWAELSTFFGLTSSSGPRLIFSNAAGVNATAAARPGAFFIGARELEGLAREDFETIRAWLTGAPRARRRLTPLEHQSEGLEKVASAFVRGRRATALMACGTGKTLFGLWAAEASKGREILVLVPSLGLLSDSLKTYLKNTSWDCPDVLIVCSDATTGEAGALALAEEDAPRMRARDLAFPVSTDESTIRAHLEREVSGVRLTFCTYQSADTLARALPQGFEFDFAVFDEAHKTAGFEGRAFSFALFDENLPVRRRLFMTATAKVWRERPGAEDSARACSMDDERLYGPVAYRLSFREAIRRGIICDYMILVSAVNSGMLPEGVAKGSVFSENGKEYAMRLAAGHLSLGQVMAEHQVKKAFTFHARVADAERFAAHPLPEAYAGLGQVQFAHVSGAMSVHERNTRLSAFAEATAPAVLSNARVLLEGVDCPAAELVGLMSPKRSAIDLQQMLGRSLRKYPGKKMAIFLLPAFIDATGDADLQKRVQESDFGELWHLISVLKEVDEEMAEVFYEIKAAASRGKLSADTLSKKVRVVGPAVTVSALRKAFATVCVEATSSSWDTRYTELAAFVNKYKLDPNTLAWNANFATHPKVKQFSKYGSWLTVQRSLFAIGTLEEVKAELLRRLGVILDEHELYWTYCFGPLKTAWEKYGHCIPERLVHQTLTRETFMAAQFAVRLRREGQAGLTQEQLKALAEINFDWSIEDALFNWRLRQLKAFTEKYGMLRVLPRKVAHDSLYGWVLSQRAAPERLSSERREKLEALGVFSAKVDSRAPAACLLEQHFTTGSCFLPEAPEGESDPHYQQRYEWKHYIPLLREQYHAARLDPFVSLQLTRAGFPFSRDDADWRSHVNALLLFKREHKETEGLLEAQDW